MYNKRQVMLINGIFSDIDAKEILLNVISAKIQFHSMKNFSAKERFGKEDLVSLKRKTDLNYDLLKINELIAHAKANNLYLKIDSTIHISLLENK